MRKAQSHKKKLAENVADIQEKLEILKAKKNYINDMLNEAYRKKPNLDSLTKLNYMGLISFLEEEVNKIKNCELQKNLISLIQANEQLLAEIFKLKSQICLISSVKNKSQNKKIEESLKLGKEKNKDRIGKIIIHTKNLKKFISKNFIELETYIGNQIKDKTIESLVTEEINQKMKEIQANWKKKETHMKNNNENSRLMRVSSIENDKCIKNEAVYVEDLKKVETEVDSLTSNLKQVFKVAAKSCNIEKMKYKTEKTNLDTQIKNLKKNDDYKKLENILSDLISENNKFAKIKSEKYKIINRCELNICSFEFLIDLKKKIKIKEDLTELEKIIKEP
ncbi:5874_t:CDS:1 [Dentiscutata heterogama]|uniref:5874_t:CDS:1 n=1 Tax=Dentiscutata heterogama TaxID=1316150 RepID=A0ACA9N702_9GLOM|nr:5874_t:CDS:1 [Dentiscutata heterogama]